jgi:hypothetical protein
LPAIVYLFKLGNSLMIVPSISSVILGSFLNLGNFPNKNI